MEKYNPVGCGALVWTKGPKPLDIVLFGGGDFVSDFIKWVTLKKITDNPQYKILTESDQDSEKYKHIIVFSHVGLLVDNTILKHPNLEPGKMYVFESTMSGSLTDGVKNIEGKSFLGVQLRDFEKVVKGYLSTSGTYIAVAPLTQKVRNGLPQGARMVHMFTKIFHKYNGVKYDASPLELSAAVCTPCRCFRDCFSRVCSNKWLFCSELVAAVFRDLGVFLPKTIVNNVVPMDFIGYDLDDISSGGIPKVVDDYVFLSLTGTAEKPSADSDDDSLENT